MCCVNLTSSAGIPFTGIIIATGVYQVVLAYFSFFVLWRREGTADGHRAIIYLSDQGSKRQLLQTFAFHFSWR